MLRMRGAFFHFDMELPSGIFNSEQVDIETESVDLTGYLNEMKRENIFQISRTNSEIEDAE